MPITAIPPLDRTSATFRSDIDTFFASRVPNFVGEVNALAANLNSIAAGGAVAIPYAWVGSSSFIGGGGRMTFDGSTMLFDATNGRGKPVLSLLAQVGASTSLVKSYVLVQGISDPSKWIVCSISNYVQAGNNLYGFSTAVLVGGSAGAAIPFVQGETVVMQITRTGDKGDPSPIGTALLRDQKGNGLPAQSLSQGSNTRVLNQALVNEIGVVLNNNQFTLLSGKYIIDASAPANSNGNLNQQLRLYNVTAGSVTDIGTNEFTAVGSAGTAYARAHFKTILVINGTTTFRLDHWVSVAGSGGSANSAGVVEVYAEVRIAKYA